MAQYIAKRILYMIPTLFVISLISFAIIQLPPGDFLDTLRLEDLPGEARLTTDVDARRTTVAFAPWTRGAERTRWERRLRDDHLVEDVRTTA